MANQLHIYTNNPTAGKTDGTEASNGTGLTPISVTLDASKAESAAVKCAVRCDEGYKIDGDVAVSKAQVQPSGNWQRTLTSPIAKRL